MFSTDHNSHRGRTPGTLSRSCRGVIRSYVPRLLLQVPIAAFALARLEFGVTRTKQRRGADSNRHFWRGSRFIFNGGGLKAAATGLPVFRRAEGYGRPSKLEMTRAVRSRCFDARAYNGAQF